MDIGEAVKERILELCREENISINKLCNMSGVTQSTVNNIVSGRNRSATISTIKKLCDGLGISIEDFFHSELFRGLEQELFCSCYDSMFNCCHQLKIHISLCCSHANLAFLSNRLLSNSLLHWDL